MTFLAGVIALASLAMIAPPTHGQDLPRQFAQGRPSPDDPRARVLAGFTPENRRYARVRQGLAIIEPFWDLSFAWILLVTGLSAGLRDRARRIARRRFVRVLIYLSCAGALAFVWQLPLSAFRDFWWEHRFGLSNQSAGQWFGDELKGAALTLAFVGGTGLLALALWGIERAGRRWWLWIAGTTPIVLLVTVVLTPLVFEPAFNRFTPLGATPLNDRILALARGAGIPARHVFRVDRSRQTKTVNAYVSGFGPSQRIVLWDTALERLSSDEILFVMGHEMGHYRLGHLWQGIAMFSLLNAVVLFVASRIVGRSLRRFGPRWGVVSAGDEAALPLFVLVLGLLFTLAQPLGCAWSRRIEHEADTFGLELTHLNEAGANAFVELGRENRSDPDPPRLLRLLLYTHPPLLERVRFALEYRPWERGRPGRFIRGPATEPR